MCRGGITDHNERRLLVFPTNCGTWLYSTLVFNTNMDDSDDEWQVIHCVSFVNNAFVMEIELVRR